MSAFVCAKPLDRQFRGMQEHATIATSAKYFPRACAYRSDAESALRDLPIMKGRKSRTVCDFDQLQTIGIYSKSRKALSCGYQLHLKVCKGSVKFKAQILADPNVRQCLRSPAARPLSSVWSATHQSWQVAIFC